LPLLHTDSPRSGCQVLGPLARSRIELVSTCPYECVGSSKDRKQVASGPIEIVPTWDLPNQPLENGCLTILASVPFISSTARQTITL